jgi:hypothetical protein
LLLLPLTISYYKHAAASKIQKILWKLQKITEVKSGIDVLETVPGKPAAPDSQTPQIACITCCFTHIFYINQERICNFKTAFINQRLRKNRFGNLGRNANSSEKFVLLLIGRGERI